MRSIGICAAAVVLAAWGDSGAATNGSGKTASGNASPNTSAPAGPAAVSESRVFREWRATCDNGNACVAFTGGEVTWLRIGMDAGPDASPTVIAGLGDFNGTGSGNPPTLSIDGKRHLLWAAPEDNYSYTVPAAEVRTVLAELAAATTITTASSGEATEIPAAGISAALLWIDERQGRLNTTTALIRRGDRPASTVPAAPALPVVTPAPAVSQAGFEEAPNPLQIDGDPVQRPVPAALAAVPAVQQCHEDTAFNEYLQKAVTASRLDASTELWGIPCDSGAYNVMYSYFLTGANGTNARAASFPAWDGKDAAAADGDPEGLTNSVYDPATRTITAFSKARGLGDCGALQTWTWTGRGFLMSREQVMGECWGMVSDFWPTTYRTDDR